MFDLHTQQQDNFPTALSAPYLLPHIFCPVSSDVSSCRTPPFCSPVSAYTDCIRTGLAGLAIQRRLQRRVGLAIQRRLQRRGRPRTRSPEVESISMVCAVNAVFVIYDDRVIEMHADCDRYDDRVTDTIIVRPI